MWLQLQSVSFVIAQVEYIDRDHTGTHRQSESGNILILAPKIESGPARARVSEAIQSFWAVTT